MATEAPELKVSIEKPAAWARRLTITVPAAMVAAEKKHAVQRLSKRVRIPGFRQGRVPADVMERKFGPAIEQEAIEKVIGEAYRQAIQTEGLQPITQGSVENIDYQPGTDLTFNVELEVRPEVELERIGGFAVVREQAPVGEQQLDEVLERLRAEHAVWEPKETGTPNSGEMATVEITPLDDATSAEPKQPRRYQIVLGEGQALPAVEDAIRTLAAGEEAAFDVDLPVNAQDPSSGTKPHRMHIKVVDVKSPRLPALDDEFARSVGDFEDLRTLRARIGEDLTREAEREAKQGMRMQLVQQIVEANPFEVPQSMVRSYLERVMPAREGADTEAIEKARMEMWPAAEFALKRMLVLERVADMEGLHATPSEVDTRIDEIAAALGRERGQVMSQLKKSGRLEEIEQEITDDKVFRYLESLSEIH